MVFILLIPSVLLFFIVLLNICKHKFSYIEVIIGIVATYVVTLGFLITCLHVSILALNYDILINITIAGCLTIFVYRKTKNIMQSGYYTLLAVIIGMIGNTLAGILLLIIFDTNLQGVRDSLILHIILATLTFPLCYVISKYAGNRLHQSYIQLSQAVQKKFIAYGFTLSALTYLLSQVNILVYRIVDEYILLSSINVVLITIVFFVAIAIMVAYSSSQQKQMEADFNNKALMDLEGYVQHLGQAYDEMRNFRHDHFNLLHALMGFADDKNQESLKTHLAKTLAYAKSTLDKLDSSMDRLKFIHTPALRGLLSVKFAHALERNIELEIDIADPIDDIPVNQMDLCRMVGIMVDNAIEELLQGNYDIKILKFGILLDDDDILIICSNTCKAPPPAEKIFQKGYSSKGCNRGFGLYSLKQITDKCGNVLVTANIKEDEFSLVLTLVR